MAVAAGRFFSSAATRTAVPAWPADLAKALQAVLAPVAGPLAGALVRRSLAKTLDRNELLEILRRGAGADADNPTLVRNLRAAFDGSLAVGGPLTRTPAPSGRAPAAALTLTPEELERATQALVGSVGPIARLLVKKTAAQARDFNDLWVRLSPHDPTHLLVALLPGIVVRDPLLVCLFSIHVSRLLRLNLLTPSSATRG